MQLSVQFKTVALFGNSWYREISAFVQLSVQIKTVALFGNSFGTGKFLLLCSCLCNLRQQLCLGTLLVQRNFCFCAAVCAI